MSVSRLASVFAPFTVALTVAVAAAQAQTVDDIVAKNIAAKGGAELLAATTSVRTVGKGTMQPPGTAQAAEVNVTTSTKRPFFVRNEMEMSGQKLIQGFDGTTLWMSVAGMPAQSLPPGPQTEAFKTSSQIDSPLLNYRAKGTKVELGEPEAENGRRLHHLIVTPKTGPTMHYYIDPETNLESKMVIDIEEGGQKMRMEMRFSDFKEVEGRIVPFTVTQFLNGERVAQMNYEKVEFNVAMDESIFRMPK